MNDSRHDAGRRVPHRAIDRGLHLATIAGIQIRLDSSVLLIFLLVVYLLGLGVGFHLGSLLVYPGIFMLVFLMAAVGRVLAQLG